MSISLFSSETATFSFETLGQIEMELQELFSGQELDLAVINRADPLFLKRIMEQCRCSMGLFAISTNCGSTRSSATRITGASWTLSAGMPNAHWRSWQPGHDRRRIGRLEADADSTRPACTHEPSETKPGRIFNSATLSAFFPSSLIPSAESPCRKSAHPTSKMMSPLDYLCRQGS
jgi:hypothetical protein